MEDEAIKSTTREDPRPKAQQSRSWAARAMRRVLSFNELGVTVVLVTMLLVIGGTHPNFLAAESLTSIGRTSAFVGIMALGMVFLLSMAEVDLSVGANYAFCTIFSALLIQGGVDPWVAAIAGVAMGATLGMVNGLIGNALAIPTIIVTLGTLSIYRGMSLVISGVRTIGGLPDQHTFFTVFGGNIAGFPATLWTLLILVVVLTIVYKRTRFGYLVRAIGSNPEAARLSGVPIARVRVAALMLQGALCGIAAMSTLAYFGAADPNTGTGYELLVIASAIIGGTSLSGGSGSVLGAALGSFIIAVIRSGLVQFGVPATWSIVSTGALIIGAVALDAFITRHRRAQSRR